MAFVMYDTAGATNSIHTSPQTLGSWQTYAIRINSSYGISIYHNMALVVDQIDSTLSGYFFDRTVTSCNVARSWFSVDGFADEDIAGLLIYDMNMTDYEFDTLHSYINSLPVADPPLLSPLLSTAKIRWVRLAKQIAAQRVGPI